MEVLGLYYIQLGEKVNLTAVQFLIFGLLFKKIALYQGGNLLYYDFRMI